MGGGGPSSHLKDKTRKAAVVKSCAGTEAGRSAHSHEFAVVSFVI